jgi:hypothetical protein
MKSNRERRVSRCYGKFVQFIARNLHPAFGPVAEGGDGDVEFLALLGNLPTDAGDPATPCSNDSNS